MTLQPARVALLALSISTACRPTDAAAPPPAPTSVMVAKATRKDVVRHIRLPATVAAWQQADLAGRVTGYVREMRVDRGDRVRRGQTLATLSVPDLVHGLGEADARAEEARSRIDQTARDAELAQTTVRRLEAARKEDARAITEQDLDVARKRAEAAESALAMARSGSARALASRAGGQAMLRFGAIDAPFDGVVIDRRADVGALVRAAGDPLLTVADISKVRVFVAVPDVETGHVAEGRAATLAVEAYPGRKFAGKVSRLSRALDQATRSMKVEIDIDNPDGALYPGMFGRVELELDTHKQAVVIPLAAVTRQKEKAFVFRADGTVCRRSSVVLGTETGALVEVLHGVKHEDPLLVSKAVLADGAAIVVEGGP